MAYRIRLTRPAEEDAYAAYEHLRILSPASAEKWLRGLFQAVFSLEELPARRPLISEAEELGLPIRQLLYGKRTGTYRIIFDIIEGTNDDSYVRILRIWHGARDRITEEDVKDNN
jgi:plasmid stabilization system protein ParE